MLLNHFILRVFALIPLIAQLVSAGATCTPFKQCQQNNMWYFQNVGGMPYYFELTRVEYLSGTSYSITFHVWSDANIPLTSLNELKFLGSGIQSSDVMIYSLNTGAGLNDPNFNPTDFTKTITVDTSSANYGSSLTGLPAGFGFQFDYCKGMNTYSTPKNSAFYSGYDYTCQCDWTYGATSFDYYTSCNGDNNCNSQAAFSNWLWPKQCGSLSDQTKKSQISSLSAANPYSYCTYAGTPKADFTSYFKVCQDNHSNNPNYNKNNNFSMYNYKENNYKEKKYKKNNQKKNKNSRMYNYKKNNTNTNTNTKAKLHGKLFL
ncbi:hypothetical protein ACO0RG_002783 [Hanseniaspora osmophila]